MYKLITASVVFLLVLLLTGCSSPKLDSLEPGAVIVAFGDSLTVGVGTSSEHSYPSVLTGLTGFRVVNAGVSGEQTAEGLARLPAVLSEHSPDLVILLEGGNDILRNVDYFEIERNLERMIQLVQASGAQVVLIGVPEKSLFSNSAPFYSDLAEKYDLAFDSGMIGSLMRSPSKKSDPIHFNKEGYRALAEGIYDLLSSSGAIN